MAGLVLVDTADRVRTVTLHRPEARNVLDVALQRDAAGALADAEADDAIDVVILTGTDPAFCAGLDLAELAEGGRNLRGGADAPATSPFTMLWTMTKPVIGAINGPAVTGGFELALGCDFLVASERARFGDTHGRVGVTPGGGMSVFLPQAVGLRRAKEMSFTGNFVDADEALRLGLVNHVVPHDELLPAAHRLAVDVAGCDTRAVRHLKRLYDAGSRVTPGEAIALEQEAFRTFAVDFGAIGDRRRGIVERGRSQRGPEGA